MAESISDQRIKAILVLLATAATIAFNVLAATGYVNGVTPAEISDKYPTIITPAGYAFSIWSLIYFGLSAFSIYQLVPGNLERFGGIRTLYIASCVLNCAWIYFWHHDQIGICLILIFALAVLLIVIAAKFRNPVTTTETFLVKGTFGLYAGWVSVASVVNLAVYLRSIDSPMASSNVVAVVIVAVATAAAILASRLISNHFYPFAVAWALTAIAVKQSSNTRLVVACAVGVIISLLMSLSFVLNLPSSTTQLQENE
jgi:translocator protein